MTQFVQGGTNPAAQAVPDAFLAINPPPAAAISGVTSSLIGIVGTATWGPVNSPAVFGDLGGGAAVFGTVQTRKYDLLTQVMTCALQGANNFVGVRVTDGTDVAASVVVLTNCITFTGKYTGTRGNGIQVAISAGTAASSWKAVVTMPNMPPETFDNITGTGNAFWVNLASAINSGQGLARPPSNLITASAGVGVTAPSAASFNLTAGTDGATTITATVLIGADTTPRTGMYALRNTGLALLILADSDTSTSWTTQLAFGKQELCQVYTTSPSNDTISNFTTTINTAAIDDPWIKVAFGDWILINDGVNNVQRYVSPQGFFAGEKAMAGPHQSVLNKPMNGIAGTQSSQNNKVYSNAELASIAAARGDIITAPLPGGIYYGARFGRNTSSDPGRRQDTYTTMTNYLARSIGAGIGQFVGRLITPDEMREASSAIGGLLETEKVAGRIKAYSVQLDSSNNPALLQNQGIQMARVMVQYLSVVEYFMVDFTGGQTVTPASTLPLAA